MTAKKKEPEEQQNADKPEAFVRDTALSIHQRIHAVMSEIEYVQKDGEFSMRTKSGSTVGFKHVTHDNVTGILRPGLIKYGILLVPSVTHREQVGQTTMLDITVDAVNIDRPDDKITFTVTGYGADSGDKGPGKAMSYACKYAMLKLFALVTGIDDEAQYHAEKGPITAHQLKQLLKLIAEANRTEPKNTPAIFSIKTLREKPVQPSSH